MHQLKCFGLMDTVHIRKLGYPIRYSFEYFLNRYRVLLDRSACDPKTVSGCLIATHQTLVLMLPLTSRAIRPLSPLQSPAAACCEAICRSLIPDTDKWKIGQTKVFLKVKER